MKLRRWYAASAASNGGQRWRITRKHSFLFGSIRRPQARIPQPPHADALDRIVRMFGERRLESVSRGLVENIRTAPCHLRGGLEGMAINQRIKKRGTTGTIQSYPEPIQRRLRGASLCSGKRKPPTPLGSRGEAPSQVGLTQ